MPPRAVFTSMTPSLHLGELLGAEHADRLFGLGQVHRDEVGERQDVLDLLVDRDAHLGSAVLRDVGVVADERHAEGARTLGDERTDAAQAEDRRASSRRARRR